MKTKYVNVRDTATSLHFLVITFDEGDKWLAETGWGKEAKLIVEIDIKASACISGFHCPRIDLRERSEKMRVSGTSIAFAEYLKNKGDEPLPVEVDVSIIRENLK